MNQTLESENSNELSSNSNIQNIEVNQQDISPLLENRINSAENGDKIVIDEGTYKIHNITINKNITLQGNGNPRDIVIDGEEKSSIFLIRSHDVHVTFKNITFINGLTDNFGGAISIETGNVYVDNCIFINNTALNDTNAGAISNYGTKQNRGYLLVNNSLFVNNHADHDGGAITTCYANCDIFNSVFINNSAHRDGGAIRVSVYGYGNVEDCIFMYNHADEWGGAYYSWSGESKVNRCIFMNNTAGTNGGAVMASGNLNLENSIIVNNDGGETGGSFYIQQPMYNTKTTMNVHNNLITNNTSPYGKEIFIKWTDAYNLYPDFNDNDWGDEDPNNSSIIDPNNVTSRSKVTSTTKSNLFNELNFGLLNRYRDLIEDYFPENYLDEIEKYGNHPTHDSNDDYNIKTQNKNNTKEINNLIYSNSSNVNYNQNSNQNSESSNIIATADSSILAGNSSNLGNNNKAYELNKTGSVAKQLTSNFPYLIAALLFICLLILIGYKRFEKEE